MSTTKPDRSTFGTVEMSAIERDTVARVTRRLLPLIMLLFLVAYVDRTNISVASLAMNPDIGLTATGYGVGAGSSTSPTSSPRCRATSRSSGSAPGSGSPGS